MGRWQVPHTVSKGWQHSWRCFHCHRSVVSSDCCKRLNAVLHAISSPLVLDRIDLFIIQNWAILPVYFKVAKYLNVQPYNRTLYRIPQCWKNLFSYPVDAIRFTGICSSRNWKSSPTANAFWKPNGILIDSSFRVLAVSVDKALTPRRPSYTSDFDILRMKLY